MIIMIVVKMSAWGSPNVQYLDKGVAGLKGWKTFPYVQGSSFTNHVFINYHHHYIHPSDFMTEQLGGILLGLKLRVGEGNPGKKRTLFKIHVVWVK